MGRPKATNKITVDRMIEVFGRTKTMVATARELGVSKRTVQRYLHAEGVRPTGGRKPDLPMEDDHLAIAQGHARALPDLRKFPFTLRDVEGRSVPVASIGAYTLKVSRRDPDYLHMLATLTNGSEIEVKTTFTHVKGLIGGK